MVKAWSSSIVLIFSAFAVVGSAPVPQFPNQLNPYGYPGYPPGLPPPFIPPTHPKFPYAPYPYASPYPITPQGYYMPPNPNNPFGVPRSGIVGGANLAAIGFSRGCDLLGEVVKSIFSGAGGLVGSVFSGILGDGALNDASPTINTAPQYETFTNIQFVFFFPFTKKITYAFCFL